MPKIKVNKYRIWLVVIWSGWCFFLLGALFLGGWNPEVHEGFAIGMVFSSAPTSVAIGWFLTLIDYQVIPTNENEILFWFVCTAIGFFQWCVVLPWIVDKLINRNKKFTV